MFSTTVHADLRNGLVGWWKFDEASGNAIDSSAYGNTGTPTGTTIVSGCKRAGCRTFNDASTEKIIVAGNTTLGNMSNGMTVAAWFKSNQTSTSTDDYILCKASSTQIEYGLYLAAPTSFKVCFNTYDNAWHGVCSDGSGYNDNNWHLAVGVFNGTTNRVYVDGAIQSGSEGSAVPTTDTANLCLGTFCASGGSGFAGAYFKGSIDDVRIYNRALSVQEVRELYVPGIVLRNGVVRNGKINQ